MKKSVQRMCIAKYLLSIEEFKDTQKGEALLKRASLCVDEERRRKAERMGTLSGRAACLGAGLLLQFAVEEAFRSREGREGDRGAEDSIPVACSGAGKNANVVCGGFAGNSITIARSRMTVYSVTELLERRKAVPVRQFVYKYGTQGKPYFVNQPFYFNLSHSGSYVLCGLSMEEIGADIQQHCGKDVGKLARRFYSERESAALEQAGEAREKQFYRLWARKEAYGKLTGKGIAEVLGVDLLPRTAVADKGEVFAVSSGGIRAMESGVSSCCQVMTSETALPEGRSLIWEECGDVKGYSIAFCRYG